MLGSHGANPHGLPMGFLQTAVVSISNRRTVSGKPKTKQTSSLCANVTKRWAGKYAHKVSEILIEEKY